MQKEGWKENGKNLKDKSTKQSTCYKKQKKIFKGSIST